MLRVWWDQKGIIYWELLEPKQTVTADLYSQQLTRLSQALERKQPYRGKGKRKVILLRDNARPHVAKMTQATIESLDWEVLSHPAYSPDLAPTDYHFGPWSTSSEKKVTPTRQVSKKMSEFFAFKPVSLGLGYL